MIIKSWNNLINDDTLTPEQLTLEFEKEVNIIKNMPEEDIESDSYYSDSD